MFSDQEAWSFYNSICFPYVEQVMERFVIQNSDREKPIVLVVPMMFESDIFTLCSHVATVTVNDAERKRRLFMRSQLTPEEVDAILARQMTDEQRRQQSARWSAVACSCGNPDFGAQAMRRLLQELQCGLRAEERAGEHPIDVGSGQSAREPGSARGQ